MSAVTYTADLSQSATFTGDAPEVNGAGDDLTVESGVTLESTGGDVILTAGDNVLIDGVVQSLNFPTGTVAITAGAGDVDGIGALTIHGMVSASEMVLRAKQDITLNGTLSGPLTDLSAGLGGVHQLGGAITTYRLRSTNGITGDLDLTGGTNQILLLGSLSVSGKFALVDNIPALTIDGDITADTISIVDTQAGGMIIHAPSTTTQRLTVDASQNQSFTLKFNGQTTGPLSAASAAADIEAALTALLNAGESVTVTQNGNVYTITLGGSLASFNPPLIEVTPTPGSTASVEPVPSAVSAHTIELIADQLQLAGGLITASDTIFLAPATPGTEVWFGNLPAPTSSFALDPFELGIDVATPTLTIGRNAAGTVTAGPIHLGGIPVTSNTLNLYSLGTVTQDADILQVHNGDGTLNIFAGGTVMLGDVLGTMGIDVGAIGGATTSGNFYAHNLGSHALTANAITTAGGEIVVQSATDVVVNGALTSRGGNIEVTGVNLALNGDIDAGSGAIGLVGAAGADGNIIQGTGRLIGTDLIALISSSNGDITLDNVGNAISGHVAFSAGQNDNNIRFTNSLAYTIGGGAPIRSASTNTDLSANPDGAMVTTQDGSVTLTTGGDITQAATSADRLHIGTLNLARLGGANPNATLDNAFNDVERLGTIDLGSGALTLIDTGGLVVTGPVTAGSVTLTTDFVEFRGTVTTSGAQVYHALEFSISQPATLKSTSGDILLDGNFFNDSDLTVDVAGSGVFAGGIEGSGRFIKEGTGTVTFSLDQTFTGQTVVNEGLLRVDAAIASLLTSVGNGGTLAGHGTVGAVIATSGGTLAPGDSPGVLTTGDIALFGGSHLALELGGTAAGLSDQLAVHGSVFLAGASLDGTLVNGFAPAIGDHITIIDNDGTDAVNGNFAGLAEGAFVTIGGTAFSISYHGGDGNDVVLTAGQAAAAPPPTVGTDGDDSFTAPSGDAGFIGGRGTDSITFNFRLVDATVTYSGNQIIIDGPNGIGHTVVSGIEVFRFTDGSVNTRDGNPLVDDLFYYTHNHDVWNAHIDADAHFAQFGWREGRDPNAWFDTKGYLAQYADVKAAGVNPLTHYDQNGWREGRDPSTAFDTGDYLSHNTDVAAAHVDPLAHFLMWGGEEGRQPFNDGLWS
jgi:fibronectin-binding autotransporter adhesin